MTSASPARVVAGRSADRPTLDDLYAETSRLELTPGWIDRPDPVFWPQPKTAFQPMSWRYEQLRQALDVAGELIDVTLSERRNLVLRNPIAGNNFGTTRTLVNAYQMLLPGELAPSHRHSAHAFRLILDARDSYSVVDGVRVPMNSGDVVLTPGGKWHGHGHEGDEPAYWLDGLDVPLVHLVEPMFYQPHPDTFQPVTEIATDTPYRFAAQDIERALDQAQPGPDGVHGPRITLPTPEMPTMGLTIERLAAGSGTRPHRSTANRIFTVVSGSGWTIVDDKHFPWTRGDTVVAPSWSRFSHHASTDATLFSVSDEPTMRALNYYRSEDL